MKFKINKNIYKKMLIGTFVIGSSLLFFSNNQLNAYTGSPEITNLTKYCYADDRNGSKLHTENDTCQFTHRTTFEKNIFSDFQISTRKICWSKDSEVCNDGATEIWKMTNLVDKGQNYEVINHPSLDYGYAHQTGNVRISQSVIVNTIWEEKAYIDGQIKIVADKNPKCWVTPLPASNSGLSFVEANGKTWVKYDSSSDANYGTGAYPRKISWTLHSYERNGGSSIDMDAGMEYGSTDDFVYDWQTPNFYIESFPEKGFAGGEQVNQVSHSLFGEFEWCKIKGGYGYDSDKPSCNATAPTGWTNESVTVTVRCTDSGSGCAKTSWKVYESTNGVHGSGDSDYVCKDKVGQQGKNPTITINNIDTIDPVCPKDSEITLPNQNNYYNTAYKVTIPCKDPQDSKNVWRNVGDRSSKCVSDNYTTTVDTSGNWEVEIADNAGNEVTCSGKTNLMDTSAPSVKITLEDGQEGYNSSNHYTSNETVTATITGTDTGGAGINRVCYKLSGATTKGETCSDPGVATIDAVISKNGKTTITAYAFDKAKEYNNGTPKFTYEGYGGNRSNNATKDVYIDKIKPTININTTPSKEWSNDLPLIANFSFSDSLSGVLSAESVWSGSTDSVKAFTDYKSAITNHPGASNTNSFTASLDTTKNNVSGNIYVHVRVCDKAYGSKNVRQSNCAYAYQGPFKFDNTNESEIKSSLDSVTADTVDWTHVLKNLTFTVTNDNLGYGRSRLAEIRLYFDNNFPHPDNNETKTFNKQPSYTKNLQTRNTDDATAGEKFSYAIDFSSLKSDPVKDGEGSPAVEGARYIKVEVVDHAGNVTSKTFGPYKWDTTKPEVTSPITFSGTEGKFYREE